MMADDNLEYLLQQRDKAFVGEGIMTSEKVIQTAEKSSNLFDFIKMVSFIVTKSLVDLDVEFVPDEGRPILLDQNKTINHPYITYKVMNRAPKGELKPRERQSVIENIDSEEKRVGAIWGQKFECLVQFNVFASEYSLAEQVMERFEEMMLTYTGFFKKNGVGELLFKRQYTDESYTAFRQTLSIRNLQYYVEIEKLNVIFKETIKHIETLRLEEKEA